MSQSVQFRTHITAYACTPASAPTLAMQYSARAFGGTRSVQSARRGLRVVALPCAPDMNPP
eukprot:9303604-Pyramimonas_sp.AAC.1